MKRKTKAKILLGLFTVSGIFLQMSTFSILHAEGMRERNFMQQVDYPKNTRLHEIARSGNLDENLKKKYQNFVTL